jgi:transketolase
MINPQVKLVKNIFSKRLEQKGTREGFGKGLVEAAKADQRVMVVVADLKESTKVEEFSKTFPERYLDVGVAEQNMMGIGAGLALAGMVPFVSSYAVFSPGRNWEQLRVSVAMMNANVKIAGHHAGLVTGPDGATHQALEDIALTRVLPNMTVIVPADFEEARKATVAAALYEGPVYLRFSRVLSPVFSSKDTPFEIGKAEVLRMGKKATIVASGHLVFDALRAGEELDAEVINMHTIKPMDSRTLITSAKKTGRVVTLEDHQVIGGLGSAAAEVLSENYPVPLRRLGVKDKFGQSGEAEELLQHYHMTWEDVVRVVGEM